MSIEFIHPDWPAPSQVRAAVTTRAGGISLDAYQSFNQAAHVGDDPTHVEENRRRLGAALDLHNEPEWLEQVHGTRIIDLENDSGRVGDGALTQQSGQVAVVMTADCLPVLLCNRTGTEVAAVHGGWRGLSGGALQAAVHSMASAPEDLLAWLGPAISQMAYEVDGPVRDAFLEVDPGHDACFLENDRGRWQANLYALARRILADSGVGAVFGGGFCTYLDEKRFFSHRRDGPCGRMASLIWLHR